MSKLLVVQDIVKSFSGKNVLDCLSFEVNNGEVLGVLGPNGAGKSTTFNIITGLIEADSGSVEFENNTNPSSKRYKRSLGVVPQDISLYSNMTVEENLRFIGKLYGVKGKNLEEKVHEILGEVNLDNKRKEAVKDLSGGMKRRVNIAAALLHNPELVIMDEPTVGVDPQSRSDIWDIIRGLKKKGKSIILTSHYVDEIERLSDRVIVINSGKVIAEGTVEELIEKFCKNYVYIVEFYSFQENFTKELNKQMMVKSIDIDGNKAKINVDSDKNILESIIRIASKLNLEIKNIDVKKPNLEDVFFCFTGKGMEA